MARLRSVTTEDGIELAVERIRDPDAPRGLVLFVHATGFCRAVWQPVIEEIDGELDDWVVEAMDQRAHGDSAKPPHPFHWYDGGRDVLAVLGDRRNVIGVGHSSGGAHLVLAERLRPGTFAGMVLIEPIVFPPPHRRIDDSPMAAATLRRRAEFASAEDAYRHFHGRGPFAAWDDRALEAYVTGCMGPSSGRWRLKCEPEDEAEFYRTGSDHDGWAFLGEISCPVTLVAGERSSTHPRDFVERMAARFQTVEAVTIPGASHFVPMERPAEVARLVVGAVSGREPADA